MQVISTSTSPSASPSGMQSAPAGRPIDLSGAIAAVDAASRSIVVEATTIVVPSTASVTGDGLGMLTFASLRTGWRVAVRATQNGSVTTASVVVVETRSLHGKISKLTGTCPSVTFVIDSTNASTGANTAFSGIACSALANGLSVSVNGVRLQDGSIVAATVAADTPR